MLNDRTAINAAGQELTDFITRNQVNSQNVLEIIKRKAIGGSQIIIERAILILHFMVCSTEEQFKSTVLSGSNLEFFQEILKTPNSYSNVKQHSLENLSVWLALYALTDLTTDEEVSFVLFFCF